MLDSEALKEVLMKLRKPFSEKSIPTSITETPHGSRYF
jgi:hypothetical protein